MKLAYRDYNFCRSAPTMEAAVAIANEWIQVNDVVVVNVETRFAEGSNKQIGFRVWYRNA